MAIVVAAYSCGADIRAQPTGELLSDVSISGKAFAFRKVRDASQVEVLVRWPDRGPLQPLTPLRILRIEPEVLGSCTGQLAPRDVRRHILDHREHARWKEAHAVFFDRISVGPQHSLFGPLAYFTRMTVRFAKNEEAKRIDETRRLLLQPCFDKEVLSGYWKREMQRPPLRNVPLETRRVARLLNIDQAFALPREVLAALDRDSFPTEEEIKAWHWATFGRDVAEITVTGPLELDEARTIVDQLFKDVPQARPELDPKREPAIPWRGTETRVRMATDGRLANYHRWIPVGRQPTMEDTVTLDVALFAIVNPQSGIAPLKPSNSPYFSGLYARLAAEPDGLVLIGAEVDANLAENIAKSVNDRFERIAQDGLTKHEIERAVSELRDFLALPPSSRRHSFYAPMFRFVHSPPFAEDRYKEALTTVKIDEIRKASIALARAPATEVLAAPANVNAPSDCSIVHWAHWGQCRIRR